MADMKALTVGGITYNIKDTGAVHGPETAQVGQTLVVSALDENGKPTTWKAADLPVVAKFETQDGAVITCTTHTAEELRSILDQALCPVIAYIDFRDCQDQHMRHKRITAVCWIDENGVISVGDWCCDGGWKYDGNCFIEY